MSAQEKAAKVFLDEQALGEEEATFLKSLRNMTKKLHKQLCELEAVASEGVPVFWAGAKFDKLTEDIPELRDSILGSIGMRRVPEQGVSGKVSRIEFAEAEVVEEGV